MNLRSAFVFTLLAVALGCSSGDNSTSDGGTPVASFCASLCDKDHSCDGTVDEQTCQETCSNANGVVVPKLRADVVDGIAQCFGSADCKTVLGGNEVQVCEAQAGAAVAPTGAVSSFCADWSSAAKTCDLAFDLATCLDEVKVYSDATVADAHACLSKACSDIAPCVAAALGLSGAPGGAPAGSDGGVPGSTGGPSGTSDGGGSPLGPGADGGSSGSGGPSAPDGSVGPGADGGAPGGGKDSGGGGPAPGGDD